MRDSGLKCHPKRNSWFIQPFSDSDFVGERERRRSVYGYFVYLCGIPIAWKIKGMRSVNEEEHILNPPVHRYVNPHFVCHQE